MSREKAKRYSLAYSDGVHYHEYASPMTLAQAKAKIAANVKRYFRVEPVIEYLDWDGDFEAIVRYQIKDDNGRSVAHISLEDGEPTK